jgi:hypothetical protein
MSVDSKNHGFSYYICLMREGSGSVTMEFCFKMTHFKNFSTKRGSLPGF